MANKSRQGISGSSSVAVPTGRSFCPVIYLFRSWLWRGEGAVCRASPGSLFSLHVLVGRLRFQFPGTALAAVSAGLGLDAGRLFVL